MPKKAMIWLSSRASYRTGHARVIISYQFISQSSDKAGQQLHQQLDSLLAVHDLCSEPREKWPAQVTEQAQFYHQIESLARLRMAGKLVFMLFGKTVQVVLHEGLVGGCWGRGWEGAGQQPVHVEEGVALRCELPVDYHHPLAAQEQVLPLRVPVYQSPKIRCCLAVLQRLFVPLDYFLLV